MSCNKLLGVDFCAQGTGLAVPYRGDLGFQGSQAVLDVYGPDLPRAEYSRDPSEFDSQ